MDHKDSINEAALTLEELMARDAEKIDELERVKELGKVEPEWLLLAEFGLYFGWEAVKDARDNKLSFGEMNKLVKAVRSINAAKRYNNIVDNYVANIAQHDKAKSLKETLREIRKQWQ